MQSSANSDKLIVTVAVSCALGLVTATAFQFFSSPQSTDRVFYGILIAVPVLLVLMAMPRVTLIAQGVLVFSLNGLAQVWEVVPQETAWVIDVMIGALVLRTLAHRLTCQHVTSGVEKYVLMLMAFAVISAFISRLSPLTSLYGMRYAFRYVLLFLAVFHLGFSEKGIMNFLRRVILPIGLIQSAIALMQFFFVRTRHPDTVTGSLGAGQTPAIGLYMLVILCYFIAIMVEKRRISAVHLIIIAWTAIAPLLGDCKFYFMFFPVLALFAVRTDVIRHPAVGAGIMLLAGIMLIGVDQFVVRTSLRGSERRNPITMIQSLPEIWKRETDDSEGRLERAGVFVNAVRLATQSTKTIIVGQGPGSVTRSYFGATDSPVAAEYAKWGVSSDNATFFYFVTEYGYVGGLLMLGLLPFIYWRGRHLRRAPHLQTRILGRMIENLTFLYAAWCVYYSAWQLHSQSYVFWVVSGMLVYLSYVVELDAKRQNRLSLARNSHATVLPEQTVP